MLVKTMPACTSMACVAHATVVDTVNWHCSADRAPGWLVPFLPHHHALPASLRPHAWFSPAVTSVNAAGRTAYVLKWLVSPVTELLATSTLLPGTSTHSPATSVYMRSRRSDT